MRTTAQVLKLGLTALGPVQLRIPKETMLSTLIQIFLRASAELFTKQGPNIIKARAPAEHY